ncbi:hypothetical protein FLAVO9AF_100195 [Flavobacterium sp. 9AF]|uniref:hypothetical protein n=1 Tax=Flavobacterium sp. 9AF TaxID=2653142 RepID=UPI0012EF2D79|nr:hypothetical protein [Flavobacterium sp. 9AF]VXB09118.1 hypothetical protein FLAVO9AF_100195 [Flavobacterium sp. 9AF]
MNESIKDIIPKKSSTAQAVANVSGNQGRVLIDNRNNNSLQMKENTNEPHPKVTQRMPNKTIQFGRGESKNIKHIGGRSFSKALKKRIGGTKAKHDISHKASAKYYQIIGKRIIRKPGKIHKRFISGIQNTDKSAFTKKDHILFAQGITALKQGRKNGKITSSEQDQIANVLRLSANRNPKNLRNKPERENRQIGAYPHFNIDNGELSDDGEDILETLNTQAEEFSDSEFSDSEELNITKSYKNLPKHIGKGKSIKSTSDQVDYRKKK